MHGGYAEIFYYKISVVDSCSIILFLQLQIKWEIPLAIGVCTSGNVQLLTLSLPDCHSGPKKDDMLLYIWWARDEFCIIKVPGPNAGT